MTIIVQTDDNVNFQTLGGLKDSISARLDREFEASDLNDFIYLAEREMERVLLVPYREVYSTMSITAAIESLPAAFKNMRRLTLLTDPKRMLDPVAPAVLEDRLRAHPLVSQCIVVGDQKPFVAALITLDAEMWPLWAPTHGLENVSIEEARTSEESVVFKLPRQLVA